jgi:mannose-1-phosphate guanylyltransferase/mannose-6-phosphate isomerase
MNVLPVILCGGSGTRLWPLSRSGYPKQFLSLSGTESLFQQAVARLQVLADSELSVGTTLVVTNEEHRFLTLDQLAEMEGVRASLLLEPAGRNTAPALTLAALEALSTGDDPVLVVTPADQTVGDLSAFTKAVRAAVRTAESGAIVVLGITPDRPETGYGYVRRQGSADALGAYAVAAFAEKPDLERAQSYLAQGDYAWNSGMFVLKAGVWLAALRRFRPDIAQATEVAWKGRTQDQAFIRPSKDAFLAIPSQSVDYAVMEHCPGSEFPIRVIPLDAGWNDLGAWDAVWAVGQRDENGNSSQGDVLLADAKDNLVVSSGRLVAAVGVENLVIVETPDAVLVADRGQSQNVKKIVDGLQKSGRDEHHIHRKVHRPWGWYDTIQEAERFKVKRILVKPGAAISSQRHYHRAEHWIVVKGTAEITCGEKVFILSENQSTYIPLGEIHRLANRGQIPLEIIEVQAGSYLGEDDIVRYDDSYGRCENKK